MRGQLPQAWRHGPLLSPIKDSAASPGRMPGGGAGGVGGAGGGQHTFSPRQQLSMHQHEGGSVDVSSGWIQMSLTVSDMGITTWTQQKQVGLHPRPPHPPTPLE